MRFTDPDGRQTEGPNGYGWYPSQPTTLDYLREINPVAAMGAEMAGNVVALARSDNYNPVTNTFLTPGQIQDVKLGILAMAIPGGKVEQAAVDVAKGAMTVRSAVGIGEHAGESIAARSGARDFTSSERAEINRIGSETGCHTCGTTNPGTKETLILPRCQSRVTSYRA